MAKRPSKTGFDRFVDEQMRSPSFARAYAEARAEIDAVDRVVREIDEARQQCGMTKAELAHAAGMQPEVVRRLFTAKKPNPTLETLVRLMVAVGRTLAVVPLPRASQRAAGKAPATPHVAEPRGPRARNSSPN